MKTSLKSVAAMLEALEAGQTLLVQAVKTSTDKIQLEFAEKLGGAEGVNLLAMFNADDARFKSGARRAWLTSTVLQASTQFGINFGDDADWTTDPSTGKQVLPIGILDPSILKGAVRLRVQVSETTVPTQYQADNIDKAAKRKGVDGDFITCKGKYIFSNTTVVAVPVGENPKHILLPSDESSVPVQATADRIVDEAGM